MKIVAVEGNIGSGKTTLCAALARAGSGAQHVVEGAPEALLQLFYADPPRYGFALQLLMRERREASLRDAARAAHAADAASPSALLLDRGLLGDYAFAAWNYACGNLCEAEWRVYVEASGGLLGVASALAHANASVLLLHDASDACLARARARGGVDAGTLTDEYMRGLSAAHVACVWWLRVAAAEAAAPVPAVRVLNWQEYAHLGVRCSAATATEFIRSATVSPLSATRDDGDDDDATACAAQLRVVLLAGTASLDLAVTQRFLAAFAVPALRAGDQ